MFRRNLRNCFSELLNQSRSHLSSSTLTGSVYFLEGLDPRRLNSKQQIQISEFISKDPRGDSFLVFNTTQLDRKIKHWYDKLPWIKPFYAMKANPLPILCKQIIDRGLSMDCASKKEIEQSLELGIDPQKIVYSNSIKNEEDLKWAYKNGVELTIADTTQEILKIQQLAPNMKILWRVAIEEQQQDELFWGFASKFGDDLKTQEEIRARMKQLKQMNVKLQGIHFHSGSTRTGSLSFSKGFELSRKCLKIGRQYGHKMQIMDIGGGFPGGDLTDKYVEVFQNTKNDPLNYQIFAEPGRFFCDNMFYVCTRIIGERQKNGVSCYHINDSIYHTFNTVLTEKTQFTGQNQLYGKIIDGKSQLITSNPKNFTLFGMTCDGTDIIGKNMRAPSKLQIGDWLVFGGLGAYSYALISNFNGMPACTQCYSWAGDVQKQ